MSESTKPKNTARTETEGMTAFPCDGGQAFPCPESSSFNAEYGMTLRDYFAAQAMNGILAKYGPEDNESLVRHAISIADAMLEALK